MIILDATTKKLQFKFTTAKSASIVVSYVDITTTACTPGVQTTSISASSSATDICAAPASSTQRQIKTISITCADDNVISESFVYYDNNGTDTVLWHGYFIGTPDNTSGVGSDQVLLYQAGSGWKYYDKQMQEVITTGFIPWGDPLGRGLQDDDGSSTVTISTNGQFCASYCGIAQRFSMSAKVYYQLTIAAATITYSEVAIYKATTIPTGANGLASIDGTNSNLTLTRCGYADTSGVFNSTGQKEVSVTFTTPIFPGEMFFACTATDATTDPAFVACLGDNIGTGHQVYNASARPSSNPSVAVLNVANTSTWLLQYAILT